MFRFAGLGYAHLLFFSVSPVHIRLQKQLNNVRHKRKSKINSIVSVSSKTGASTPSLISSMFGRMPSSRLPNCTLDIFSLRVDYSLKSFIFSWKFNNFFVSITSPSGGGLTASALLMSTVETSSSRLSSTILQVWDAIKRR